MQGDAGAVLSFEYVSETLGLDAEQVRSALRRWRDRSRHRARPESVAILACRATPPRLKKASGE
jgi:hypothetical protein